MAAIIMPGSAWFASEQVHPLIWRIWEPHVHRFFRGNMWFVEGRDADLLIDFGMGIVSLDDFLPRDRSKPLVAVATHCHVDHIGSFHEFSDRRGHRLEADVFATTDESRTFADVFRRFADGVTHAPLPDWDVQSYSVPEAPLTCILDESDIVDIGDFRFRILHLPGHSPGSISLLDETRGLFFSGDAVYAGTLVDDIPGADIPTYVETMKRLASLDVETVCAGHNEAISGGQMQEIANRYVRDRLDSPGKG